MNMSCSGNTPAPMKITRWVSNGPDLIYEYRYKLGSHRQKECEFGSNPKKICSN
jgi:hypothetical protein